MPAYRACRSFHRFGHTWLEYRYTILASVYSTFSHGHSGCRKNRPSTSCLSRRELKLQSDAVRFRQIAHEDSRKQWVMGRFVGWDRHSCLSARGQAGVPVLLKPEAGKLTHYQTKRSFDSSRNAALSEAGPKPHFILRCAKTSARPGRCCGPSWRGHLKTDVRG